MTADLSAGAAPSARFSTNPGITALQQLCAPFEAKRPDSLTPASCLEVVQRITGVMREIDGEIDALIGR
jgi:two-component system sensor histidine kinase EvgS